MSKDKKENHPEIKKVSDNIYINVSTIKTDNIDLDKDEDDISSPEEKSEKDRNQGDETVGIP